MSIKWQILVFTNSNVLIFKISENVCSPECLQGGACVSGLCMCPEGYIGDYCQYEGEYRQTWGQGLKCHGSQVKGGYYDHFWIHRSKWSFWYQMKAPIFLITPVKLYVQQMLLVKVISENV